MFAVAPLQRFTLNTSLFLFFHFHFLVGVCIHPYNGKIWALYASCITSWLADINRKEKGNNTYTHTHQHRTQVTIILCASLWPIDQQLWESRFDYAV